MSANSDPNMLDSVYPVKVSETAHDRIHLGFPLLCRIFRKGQVMRNHIGMIAFSLALMIVATIEAEENTGPYRNITSVHVSASGQHTAICTREGDQHRVIINGHIYGPYDDIDCRNSSPFRRSSSIWAFRGTQADRCRLVVNGISYGPYDEVWPPNAAGQSWGALVKQGDKYHVLVNGKLSTGFDEIAGDHRVEERFSLDNPPIDVPLFFSRDDWAAFGRIGSNLFIVTKSQTYGPFQTLGDEEFSAADGNESSAELVNYLSFDRSTLAVPVSKMGVGGESVHYVWINGMEHGPADLLPEFYAIGKNMSMDGRKWAFFDKSAIYSSEGKLSRATPRDTVISDNGRTMMYSYGPDDDIRFVVNGCEFGPFKSVGGLSCSPDGLRWVANYWSLNENKHYVQTESGLFGPIGAITTTEGFPLSSGARFIGSDWICVGRLPDKKLAFLINGKPYGPYTSVATPGSMLARSTDNRWAARATRDDRVDVFSTGKLLMSTPPFVPLGIVHASESHWHMQGRRNGERILVEDGKFFPLGPIKRTLGEFHSENCATAAIRAVDENNQHLVIFSHKTYGPFTEMAGDVRFSFDGTQWAFLAPAKNQFQVVSSQGESPLYDSIRDLTLTKQGATFVGIDSSGQWWLQLGDQRLGPFTGCGFTSSEGRLSAVTISGGEVRVHSIGNSTPTSDCPNLIHIPSCGMFGRRYCR